MNKFEINSSYKPFGDQINAIKEMSKTIKDSKSSMQTLLGVTGSGKTFTVANVIEKVQMPTLIIAHNKTLAAQLYEEMRLLFPKNKVCYFVSYYDYYQPESYMPTTDQYIEKDASINSKLDQLRLAATAAILSRNDTIVIASVSCIYGLGNPENYIGFRFPIEKGQKISRREIISKLIGSQYQRNDTELSAGRFRVKGDVIDFIAHDINNIIRIEMFGDEIDRIIEIDKLTGEKIEEWEYLAVYPAKHFMVPEKKINAAIKSIKKQLDSDLKKLNGIEAHRLKQRTMNDIEMIKEIGYCKGIENYSRHFDGRKKGERPYCLLDYFPDKFLIIIDESHQSIPQLNAMYKGDVSRKKNLIDFGFRLSSAYDNRPLKFGEFESFMKKNHTIFLSATPGDYEKKHSEKVVEQIIRPTGLVDPEIEIHGTDKQIDHLKNEIEKVVKNNSRALVTTLTKKMAEELSDYLSSNKIKTRYLHSDIDTLERDEIIRELRLGVFDVLVGINLLREGLDIPEVELVCIMDADKEGFLRNDKSLIQTIGRAARNKNGKVILYADIITKSIETAIKETNRRRNIQIAFNKKHGIIPKTIKKPIKEKVVEIKDILHIPKSDIPNLIIELECKMEEYAEKLEFEKAILTREKIKKLKNKIKKS